MSSQSEQTQPQSVSSPTRSSASKSKGSQTWRWIVRLGGTALLVFFLWKLNLDPVKVAQQLWQANLWLVALAVLGVFPLNALKAWRWQLILNDLRIHIGFNQAYRLYALGTAVGSFTPGQSGDLIKAWYLQDQGFRLSTGIISVVLDRLFDVAALILIATSGLLVLGANFASLLPALIALLVGVGAGLLVLSVPRLRDPLLRLTLRLVLRKRAGLDATGEAEAAEQLKPIKFGSIFGITVLATLVVLGRVWLLAAALSINLDFMQVMAASSLATVISLIPISIGGIGARDITLVYVLGQLGYDQEKAVGLSTFILLLQLVNLLVGYLIWKVGKPTPTSTPQLTKKRLETRD